MSKSRRWQLEQDGEAVRNLVGDPLFRELVKLGRAVNSLRTCQYLLLEEREGDFPVTKRLRMTAFLYTAALLRESCEFIRNSPHLNELDHYDEWFTPLFGDDEIREFIDGPLRDLRNQGVFHFGDESIPNAVAELEDETVVFQIGEADETGKVYHFLSDWAVLHAALDVPPAPEEAIACVRKFVERVRDLSVKVTRGADWLIAEGAKATGWRLADYALGNDDPDDYQP